MRLAAIALALIAQAAYSEEIRVSCPTELSAGTLEFVHTPVGWIGQVPNRLMLTTAGVTVGSVNAGAVEVGEQVKLDRKRFRIDYRHLAESKDEKWLTCAYGGAGAVTLSRRVPDETAQCSLLFTPDGQGGFAVEAKCRSKDLVAR